MTLLSVHDGDLLQATPVLEVDVHDLIPHPGLREANQLGGPVVREAYDHDPESAGGLGSLGITDKSTLVPASMYKFHDNLP
jgi:hypothetical protein